MKINHKITVPSPCPENWNKMTPNENGRFCMNCSKTVVDFTVMNPNEIQHFFTQNKNKSLCGRFKNSQLDTVDIQIPREVLYAQTNYRKMFFLALFVAMGTTLFSCQDKDGKKQKIDKVEIVTDTIARENITVGDVRIDPDDSIHNPVPPPPPPPKVDQVKFVQPPVIDAKKEKTTKADSKKTVEEESSMTTSVATQTNADFPGGIEQFYNFFAKQFKKPEGVNLTKTTLAFAVEKNGSVSYLQCSPEVDAATEKEIIRVLSLCPKWEPGKSNGKKIKMQYSLPITLE